MGGAVVGPSRVEVLVRHHPRATLFVAEREVGVELLAGKPQVRRVAGEHHGVDAGVDGRFDDRHEAVWPAPSVVSAPPLAVEVFTDLAAQPDVVREDATVGVGAFAPPRKVIGHPLPKSFVRRIHERVGHLSCRVQVERHVAPGGALIHLDDDLREDVVVEPWGGCRRERHAGQVFEWRMVTVEHPTVRAEILGGDDHAWPLAAGLRRPDDPEFSVVVGCERVFARVHAGKTIRTLTVDERVRLGEAEEVVEEVRLAVVHPVVVTVELAIDLAVLRPLPGDGIPHLACRLVDGLVAADAVEERQVHERLVWVVRAVHPRPLVAPDQRPVCARVPGDELGGGRVQGGDDLPLEQRPAGSRHLPVRSETGQIGPWCVHQSSPSIFDEGAAARPGATSAEWMVVRIL